MRFYISVEAQRFKYNHLASKPRSHKTERIRNLCKFAPSHLIALLTPANETQRHVRSALTKLMQLL